MKDINMTKRLTTTLINKEILKSGGSEKLTRGNGYFYFYDGNAACWPSSSVYVYRLSDFTLAEWMHEYHQLRNRAI